jgi:hypothetical protein
MQSRSAACHEMTQPRLPPTERARLLQDGVAAPVLH